MQRQQQKTVANYNHSHPINGTQLTSSSFDGTDDWTSLDSSTMSDTVEIRTKTVIELNHHEIEHSDDFMSFECERCGTLFEVPEIFQASNPFYVAIYQMYIFGHYRHNRCPEEDKTQEERLRELLDEQDDDNTFDPRPQPQPQPKPYTPPNTNPKDLYWMDNNSIYQVDTGNGSIVTDGNVVIETDDPNYDAGEKLSQKDITETFK